MVSLFLTANENLQGKLENLLTGRIGRGFEIIKSPNGKPCVYKDGEQPVEISLSHSRNFAVIAVADEPVGVDMEFTDRRLPLSVLRSFTKREQEEINFSLPAFLKNWTAKEAFIKMKGATIAHILKRTEFFDGCIYLDGNKQDVNICFKQSANTIICVCSESGIIKV